MASLRDPKKAVLDISEGMLCLTSGGLWGNSTAKLKELERGLISKQNRLLAEFPCGLETGDLDEADVRIQRVERALGILHEYFKKHRIH